MEYTQSINIEQTQSGYTLTIESLIDEQTKKTSNIMKYLIYIFAFFTIPAAAQEYTYQIEQDSSGLFTLDQIEEFSDTRQSISRTTGIDSAQLQSFQYAKMESNYNTIAAYEARILAALREINAMRASLRSVGLDGFNAHQYAKFDSTFTSETAFWISSGSTLTDCYVQYREGLTQVIRRNSDNAVIGTILPLSANYILVNVFPDFQVEGVDRIEMTAVDSRRFFGRDENNTLYRLIIIR